MQSAAVRLPFFIAPTGTPRLACAAASSPTGRSPISNSAAVFHCPYWVPLCAVDPIASVRRGVRPNRRE
jgi:hypothetical protein